MNNQETLKTLNDIRLRELQKRVESMKNGTFNEEKEERKTDCYFYHIEKDMGANIVVCCYDNERWNKMICPCKDCRNYISNYEVSQIVRDIVNWRET